MFQLTGYFQRFGSRADGSASLSFVTNELNGDDFAKLREHQNEFGHILFKGNAFSESDIPKGIAENSSKTPSKRLRSVLWVLYSQQGEQGSFEAFYADRMERIINQIKSKLD